MMLRTVLLITFALLVSLVYCQFTDINAGLPGYMVEKFAWGDYDNDGYLDFLMDVHNSSTNYALKIFHNNQNNTFTAIEAGLPDWDMTAFAWGDYDNDGYLDLAISGYTWDISVHAGVYHNNGNGTFTDVNADIVGCCGGAATWLDYDNDGDLDLLMTGERTSYTHLYRNNGNGTFSDTNSGFIGAGDSRAGCIDFDNDGDLDIFITGESLTQAITHYRLYRNDGNDVWTEIPAYVTAMSRGSVDFCPFDDDGDWDLLLAGYSHGESSFYNRVYISNGNGTFYDGYAGFPGICDGKANWGDYDNDGDWDVLMNGYTGQPLISISRIYENNGSNHFSCSVSNLPGTDGTSSWGDYNNDGRLDFFLGGFTQTDYIARVYRNNLTSVNNPPAAPANLHQYKSGEYTIFTWNSPLDDHTPASKLTYMLRIGTTPGGYEIMGSMANSAGLRKIPMLGYANSTCSWRIKNDALPPVAHYYWSVQAIDSGLRGSAFAPEIEVDPTPVEEDYNPPCNMVVSVYPNPLTLPGKVNILAIIKSGETGTVAVYNIRGEEIKRFNCKPGENNLVWDSSGCSTGLYLYQLITQKARVTGKLVISR